MEVLVLRCGKVGTWYVCILSLGMGEEGREGGRERGSSQQQPDVGPLCGCGYGDISLYLGGMYYTCK